MPGWDAATPGEVCSFGNRLIPRKAYRRRRLASEEQDVLPQISRQKDSSAAGIKLSLAILVQGIPGAQA